MKADRPGPEIIAEHDSLAALKKRATNALLKGLQVELLARDKASGTGEWKVVATATTADELSTALAARDDVRGMKAIPRMASPEKPEPLVGVRPIEQLPGFLAGCDLIQRGFPVALLVRGSTVTTQPIKDIAKLREHYAKTPTADVGIRLGRGFAALRFNRSEFAFKAQQLFKQRRWLADAACFGSPGGATVYVFKSESVPNVSIIRGVSWVGSGVIEAPPSLDQEWICEGPVEAPHDDLRALLIDPVKRAEIREIIADPASTQLLPKNADLSAVELLDHALFDAPCPGRPSWDGPVANGLPAVFIGPDEYRVGTAVLEAISRDADVFRRGNMLVTVNPGEDFTGLRAKTNVELGPTIVPLGADGVRALITRDVCLVRRNPKDGTVSRVHPPSWLASNLMARGVLNRGLEVVPPIDGVRETPILRADGTVLSTPGYDSDTAMLLLDRGCYPSIPENPTQEDAIASAAMLKEAFVDFPFENESDRSAALAAVLTFFARPAYSGPTPLFFIEANKAGTGKGLIVDAITQITLGRLVERQSLSEEEEETRKKITSVLMSGAPMGFIDNIDSTFGGPSLDAVITAQVWTDRVLGGNNMVQLQNRTVWICTGNNPEFRGDMTRRICRIRMVTPEQNPELRTNYKHEKLLDWIKQVRPQLVTAALTILRAYQVAGQPRQKMRSWGSFEGWSDYVRASLVFAGCIDPAPESWRLEEMTPQVSAERMLVIGLRELLVSEQNGRASAARILQKLQQNDRAVHNGQQQEQWLTFRSACEELFALRPGQLPNARALGRKLTRLRDTNIIDNILRAVQNPNLNMLEYFIESAQSSTHTENASNSNGFEQQPQIVRDEDAQTMPTDSFGGEDFGTTAIEGDGFDEYPQFNEPAPEPLYPWREVQQIVDDLSTTEGEQSRVVCLNNFIAEARKSNRALAEPRIEFFATNITLIWSSRRDNRIAEDCAWHLTVSFSDLGQLDWEFNHAKSGTHVRSDMPVDYAEKPLLEVIRRLSTMA